MNKLIFTIVDVFAEKKYAGNQLAVFLNCDKLSDDEMQSIAKEMNFSETTFILSEVQNKGGYDVRIFTPAEEVPFAGHPTLGTAHVLRKEVIRERRETILLNLKVGQIPVSFNNDTGKDTYWMEQVEPVFGRTLKPEDIAPIVSLDPGDIDTRFPVEEVSTGLPHIIVPLRSRETLKRARIAHAQYSDFIRNRWAKPILIFSPEPYNPGSDVSVRMFADCFGIPEDPATGSGNGCLAGYLVKHRYWGRDKIEARSDQGYEVGRPSLLLLKAEDRNGSIHISIGGRAVTVARGEFV